MVRPAAPRHPTAGALPFLAETTPPVAAGSASTPQLLAVPSARGAIPGRAGAAPTPWWIVVTTASRRVVPVTWAVPEVATVATSPLHCVVEEGYVNATVVPATSRHAPPSVLANADAAKFHRQGFPQLPGVVDAVVLHPEPQRAPIGTLRRRQELVRSPHDSLAALARQQVVAEVQLLYVGTIPEQLLKLHHALVANPVAVELQDPEVPTAPANIDDHL
mmetsp:Transcript_65452/g.182155  ORF Transcript_65452/g.182155 Transcript_65452/m.182155 type:complete len:219 (+) Transcript_65452:583-1239(+)